MTWKKLISTVLLAGMLLVGTLLAGCSSENAENAANNGGNVDNIVGSTENMTGTNDSGLYNLTFDGYGFETEKTTYAEGENVTVYYGMVGTDTDYNFDLDCDDVKLLQSYDSVKGFVFNFVMPAHDVKLSVNAQNTMVNNRKWK